VRLCVFISNEKQKPERKAESRIQKPEEKETESVNVASASSFWILDSEFWILLYVLASDSRF
jgi:hypothetical protein